MLVQLDRLQRLVSQIGITPSWLRDTFFYTEEFYPNGEINIEIERNGQQVAPFVAPEVGGKVMERLGNKIGVFTPPEVAPQLVITTKNLLAAAGNSEVTFIEAGSTPETRQMKLIRKDFDEMDKSITRREELMCAEVLFKGQITVFGEGYATQVIKFWDDADKPYLELSGNAQWNNAASDPIADLELGIQKVQERSGITPTDVVMSPATWAYVRKNEGILKQLDTKNLDIGEIYGQNKANESGVRLVGRLSGLNIWTYSRRLKVEDETGEPVLTQVVPDNLILFGSPYVPTEMAYGVVTITDVKAQTLRHLTGRRVVNQYLNQKKPAGIVNETKAAPLPIPKIPDGFFVIKVVTP